jgi:quercetin 2,3-dioxygenase
MTNEMTTIKTTRIIHRAENRGHANHGWLDTYHSFSFARYFNPEKINFGALRVWNDDVISAGKGFDSHPHDNMEIITIPLSGAVLHRDSMGHEEEIKVNEVQVMSAGKGLFHAEFNASKTDELALFQIWIFPDKNNVNPVYNQQMFDVKLAQNQWQKLVGPYGEENVLNIHQDAWVSRTFLTKDKTLDYDLKPTSFGTYLMVVDGSVEVDGVVLNPRDAIGLIDTNQFKVKALENSYIINIEVPNVVLQ